MTPPDELWVMTLFAIVVSEWQLTPLPELWMMTLSVMVAEESQWTPQRAIPLLELPTIRLPLTPGEELLSHSMPQPVLLAIVLPVIAGDDS